MATENAWDVGLTAAGTRTLAPEERAEVHFAKQRLEYYRLRLD